MPTKLTCSECSRFIGFIRGDGTAPWLESCQRPDQHTCSQVQRLSHNKPRELLRVEKPMPTHPSVVETEEMRVG